MSTHERNPLDGEVEFDADDPRLTAYALGALEGEERAAIESLLLRDPEARAFVDGLTGAAEALGAEYAVGEGEALLADQREVALTPPDQKAPLSMGRRVAGWTILSAAGLAVAASVIFFEEDAPQRADVVRGPSFNDWMSLNGYASAPEQVQLSRSELKMLSEMGYLSGSEGGSASGDGSAGRLVGQLGYSRAFVAGTSASESERSRGELDAATIKELRELGYLGGDEAGRGRFERREILAVSGESGDEQLQRGRRSDRGGEGYAQVPENPFRRTSEEARSTFSIDVDTAAYSNARRYLTQYGQLPPPDSVRIEEFINYFTYDYPQPDGGMPFSVNTEVSRCPWEPSHQLVMVGIQGKTIERSERKPANLVFLVDVSGSMNSPNKLPLLQSSLKLLADQMGAGDQIAIVVYAGSSGLVLPSTRGNQEGRIETALNRLSAGGSTNGGAGIQLAYQVAEDHFLDEGVNRVILCTDGDFNVGTTSHGALTDLIEKKRETGVFLSVLGFGSGNVKDNTMELLADKGNGNYAFIDTIQEARKVLVEQMNGTLQVIAKDVKIQVEFNPATVGAWRLIGYENRILAHKDFNDDRKDAGEVGAGSSVTALYQVVPNGVSWSGPGVDESRYAPPKAPASVDRMDELMFLRLRYKEPDGKVSKLIETPIRPNDSEFRGASRNMRFAGSVAGFAMLLKKSAYSGNLTPDLVRLFAQESVGEDEGGYRREFLTLVDQARGIWGN